MRRAAEHLLTLGPRAEGQTLQQWLHKALCDAIHDGRLPAGSRMPASRSLALDHGLSRSTVTAVFERLLADGYISAHVGRGSFVAPRPPQLTPVAAPAQDLAPRAPALSRRGRQLAEAGAGLGRGQMLQHTFEADRIDTGLFPAATWARLTARRAQWHETHRGAAAEPLGLTPLRELLAQQLALTRGIRCDAGQVVLVAGARQAMDLLARLLLNPGEGAWVEDPGSPALQALLTAAGVRTVAVPADIDGLRVEDGRRMAPQARLAFTTAGAQMPLGQPLSAPRRLALLDWARTAGAYVVDEDRDGDFIFDGSAATALKAQDTADSVIHVGNLCFSMAPCLRLGYLVLPRRLVEPFGAALALTQGRPSLLEQAVLHDFIADGHWARHLREARQVYGARADALRQALDTCFGRWLQFAPARRGLNLTAWLPAGTRDTDIAARAATAGVRVAPLALYRLHQPAPPGLRLGFAAFSEAGIRVGVQKLAAALERGGAPQTSSR